MLLFGRLADVAGWRERVIDAPPASVFALRDLLAADSPALAEALSGAGVKAAVDKALVHGDAAIAGAAEVAFLPPMSGG